jgi:hypothetical protein
MESETRGTQMFETAIKVFMRIAVGLLIPVAVLGGLGVIAMSVGWIQEHWRGGVTLIAGLLLSLWESWLVKGALFALLTSVFLRMVIVEPIVDAINALSDRVESLPQEIEDVREYNRS